MMAGQIIYIDNLKIKKTLKRINELIKDTERNGVLWIISCRGHYKNCFLLIN